MLSLLLFHNEHFTFIDVTVLCPVVTKRFHLHQCVIPFSAVAVAQRLVLHILLKMQIEQLFRKAA